MTVIPTSCIELTAEREFDPMIAVHALNACRQGEDGLLRRAASFALIDYLVREPREGTTWIVESGGKLRGVFTDERLARDLLDRLSSGSIMRPVQTNMDLND